MRDDRDLSISLRMLLPFCLAICLAFAGRSSDCRPQTWFHLIGGNVSKEGLSTDLDALADAGFGGVQLFHGQVGENAKWPRTAESIPCLSSKWDEVIRHAAEECARLGLKFEMQNCPGWSMSGGPWISPTNAMRKLVCFEAGKMPAFEADDDYHKIGSVTFPRPLGWGLPDPVPETVTTNGDVRIFDFGRSVAIRTLILPPPVALNSAKVYELDVHVDLEAEKEDGWENVMSRPCPRGSWQDDETMSFSCREMSARRWRLTFRHSHPIRPVPVRFSSVSHVDGWEALGGWAYRDLPKRGTALADYRRDEGAVTLVFGHVNLKRKNHPAPAEATGWECDKLDTRGFSANFDGYLGRLVRGPLAGGKLKGLVVDSWECARQSWTWKMEEEFRRLNGYELRDNLPTLFGFVAGELSDAERFLRDWRRTVSTLIEENYYRTIAELGKKHGLTVQYETAFADVLPGDPLRYWKYADIPMCEFWQPFDNKKGSVGSDDFKPVRPCVSAAHVYGKRRVQAEAFTSFELTYDENFKTLKSIADRNFARGVTHLVFHTFTHQPQTGADFLPPGSSFGSKIGTPFLRGQTWWRFLPLFTDYLTRCGEALERGLPVVDVLWYLGDEIGFRPSENARFPEGYKYDYCNFDVLMTRLDVKDGRFVLPDGMSYRVLWVPTGTFLLPETERRLELLEQKGGRIVRGEFAPDWPSELEKLGFSPASWYQRRDGNEDIFFVVLENGESEIISLKDGQRTVLDPMTGFLREPWRDCSEWTRQETLELKPRMTYPDWATERIYEGTVYRPTNEGPVVLSLGDVRDWAEVTVNGKSVATLWCAPYVCELTPFLKGGENSLRVTVTSTWYNRLVHDAALPVEDRKSWTICGPRADSPTHPSGLMGPVAIHCGAPIAGDTCLSPRGSVDATPEFMRPIIP